MACRVLLCVCIAAVLTHTHVQGKIVSFNVTDPDLSHIIYYTEIQFKRPKVSFEVLCPDGPANVAWLLVPSDLNAIHTHQDDTFLTARCDIESSVDGRPKCTAGIYEGSPNSSKPVRRGLDGHTPSLLNGFLSDIIGGSHIRGDHSELNRRLRRDDSESSSSSTTTTESPSTTATTTTTVSTSTTVKTTLPRRTTLDPDSYQCDSRSGVSYIPSRSHFTAIGGCTVCSEVYQDLVTINTQNMTYDGYYTLWIESFGTDDDKGPKIVGTVTFKNSHGYLPADLYPLLKFYGAMGLVYVFTGLVWLVLSALYYRDLLRLQFWIGAVIALGMLEMSVSYSDLEHTNSTGRRSHALLVFAKLLFACKNTLARLLVLIVSMGFGIVKPRLGSSVKQIIAIGLSYFFFAAAYGVTHALGQTEVQAGKTEMMVIIPLSVLDAAICWWIFISLSHTMKTLSLRNNAVKLQLYLRFQYVLIVCVIATVLFAIWSIADRYRGEKNKDDIEDIDWQNAWWQEGYWHLLFYLILLAIMYLWRPNNNNNRYAYTALETDNIEDEGENEVVPNFGTDAIKMRTLTSRNSSKDDIDADLRWVEENIPSSTSVSGGIGTTSFTNDTAFPNLAMDSEEEIMQTKFEMSKME